MTRPSYLNELTGDFTAYGMNLSVGDGNDFGEWETHT